MKNFKLSQYLGMVALVALSALVHAQTYTQLYNFNCAKDGCNPGLPALFAQGEDGSLYGTLPSGGTHGDGTVAGYALSGAFSTVYNFGGVDGFVPQSGLILGFDGNFYGTTTNGGTPGKGTAFKVSGGVVTVLHEFTNGTDGGYPWVPPIQAPDGNIYGITYNGTTPGILYRITPSGVFSVITSVPSETVAPLILGADGKLYGTTPNGGTYNAGTVFQLTLGTKPKLKIIHSFNSSVEGANPAGPVMQGIDGRLYGTTRWGGSVGRGTAYSMSTAGGTVKLLHNFQGTTDGTNPSAGFVQGSDKYLYSVAASGGANSYGTLFKLNTTGTTFAVLHNFDKTTGAYPSATPTLHTNGKIYGVTTTGGTQYSAYGVIYGFDNGLKPFASLVVLWSGKVGMQVGILGQGFSTATGVKFGTGAGTFNVISDTYMIAKVAAGATTGNVTVLEPGGNLVTPQVFKVIPTVSTFAPASGTVGTQVVITGMSLTQTTSVSFGGVKATSFTVNSNIQVTATVPTGAKTGKVTIVTKGGSAVAPGTFTVS